MQKMVGSQVDKSKILGVGVQRFMCIFFMIFYADLCIFMQM